MRERVEIDELIFRRPLAGVGVGCHREPGQVT
jgi:hypothetical protein